MHFHQTPSFNFVFKTYYRWYFPLEQDIWNWKVFPDKIFIAGIWFSEIIRISSKNFHVIEGLGIEKWKGISQLSINCQCVISLIIKHITFDDDDFILSYHLSIDWILFKNNIVPVIQLNFEIEVMLGIIDIIWEPDDTV